MLSSESASGQRWAVVNRPHNTGYDAGNGHNLRAHIRDYRARLNTRPRSTVRRDGLVYAIQDNDLIDPTLRLRVEHEFACDERSL